MSDIEYTDGYLRSLLLALRALRIARLGYDGSKMIGESSLEFPRRLTDFARRIPEYEQYESDPPDEPETP